MAGLVIRTTKTSNLELACCVGSMIEAQKRKGGKKKNKEQIADHDIEQ